MKSHYVYIPLPDDLKTKLKEIQKSFEEDARQLDLQTVSLEDAHVTLSVLRLSEGTAEILL